MRIVYKLEPTGEAVNIRNEGADYILAAGELETDLPEVPPQEALHGIEFMRLLAVGAVDLHAETARLRYITGGAGQAMTYLEKRADAQRYKADGYPSAQLAQYPWVQAEKAATGQTGQQAADAILAKAAEWEAAGANIDRERRAGKVACEAAADVAAVEAARNAALAALELI